MNCSGYIYRVATLLEGSSFLLLYVYMFVHLASIKDFFCFGSLVPRLLPCIEIYNNHCLLLLLLLFSGGINAAQNIHTIQWHRSRAATTVL